MEGGLFHTPEFAKLINERAVPLIAHSGSTSGTPHKPETYVDPRTKEEKQRCPVYKTMSCEDHEKVYTEGRAFLQFRGTPTNFLFSADKKILHDGGSNRVSPSSRAYEALLDEIQPKLGEKMMPASVHKDVEQELAEALELLGKDEYKKGIRSLLKVNKLLARFPEAYVKRYQEVEKVFVDKGEALLQEALSLAESDSDQARKQISKISKDFRGLDIADRAKEELKKL